MASTSPPVRDSAATSPPLVVPDDYTFPFQPYAIQSLLMKSMYSALESSQVAIIESPTGTGKSLSMICCFLSWLRDDQTRMTQHALQTMEDSVRSAAQDEPEWMIKQELDRRKIELTKQEQILSAQLETLRVKLQKVPKSRPVKEPPFPADRSLKRQRANTELSDDEFAITDDPSSNPNEEVSSKVEALLAKYQGSRPRQMAQVDHSPDVRKVIFTSRTHSQLSQFIGEIRKTGFADTIRGIALGSRSNLCINEDIRKSSHGSLDALNEACTDLQTKPSSSTSKDDGCRCPYLPRADDTQRMSNFQAHALAKIRDIEELAELGRTLECCPYYGARHAVRQAQLVTLPYNLLMQKSAREAVGLQLDGHIVVIDEAHNIIDNILSIHAVTVTSTSLEQAHVALSIYLEKFSSRLNGPNRSMLKQFERVLKELLQFCTNWRNKITRLKKTEEMIKVNDLLTPTSTSTSTLSILDQINLRELDVFLKKSHVSQKLSGYAQQHLEKSTRGHYDLILRNLSHSQRRSVLLGKFYQIQSLLLSLANSEEDGRLYLTTKPDTNGFEIESDESEVVKNQVTIKYQLLNPSESFKEIVLKSRSVVLAGGTMAPMSDFQNQLFSYLPQDKVSLFSCSHIVSPDHIFARVVGLGPSGQRLELKFESRKDEKLLDELGRSLANICSLVPNGVVCFVPSYSILDDLVKRWISSGIIDRISRKKSVFVEERSVLSLSVLDQYKARIDTNSGAILLAVVGGRLSEVSDQLCRAVVIIGIPYPNAASVELRERMKYVERLQNDNKAGKAMYSNLAFKAVNQSIGRAIRHINDWSAILLLDARYSTPSSQEKLPKWIGNGLQVSPTFGSMLKGLASFNKERSQTTVSS